MDKNELLELLEQVRDQSGDWRLALETAIDMVAIAITVERRSGEEGPAPDITISRGQAEYWAQRKLTDLQFETLRQAMPLSSVPDAVAAIVDGFDSPDEEDI